MKRFRQYPYWWLLDCSFAFFNEWFWAWDGVILGLLLGLTSWMYCGEPAHLGLWLLGCFVGYTIVGTAAIFGSCVVGDYLNLRDIAPDDD